MSSIILASSFLQSLEDLNKQEKRVTIKKLDQFARDRKGGGFQVHPLDRILCDKRFKSARINRDVRLIFSQEGESVIILYVGRHDAAYSWAEGKYLDTSSFGALYVHDHGIVVHTREEKGPFQHPKSSLLSSQEITAKDLEKLGLSREEGENLLRITCEDTFLHEILSFPQEIQEGLMSILVGEKSITRVCAELMDPEVGDETSLEAALTHRDTGRRFYLVEDAEELSFILNQEDMEEWKLFLHPQQQWLVKHHFQGPALIEGGPGTGKTVVGIHRAVHLARNVFPGHGRILFCTFSKKLALSIKGRLQELLEQKQVHSRIHVEGVDGFFFRLLHRYRLAGGRIDPKALQRLLEETYREHSLEEPLAFYRTEYHEVIQRFHIRSLEEYVKVQRPGRREGLSPSLRKKVWNFFQSFLEKKEEEGLVDFEDHAFTVLQAVKGGVIPPLYDSILIDEAQDLSPMKLTSLSLLAREQANNLLLLSDSNQRIYRLRSWKKDVQLDIVGRTYYLTINYRTTKEIRDFADRHLFLGSSREHLRDYKSLLTGPKPLFKKFSSERDQYQFMVERVKEALERGISPHEICILVPTDGGQIAGILTYEGIAHTLLKGEVYPKRGCGVGISTLHGSKGLEFRVVIIMNEHLLEERFQMYSSHAPYLEGSRRQMDALKYVACTRAREELVITRVSGEEGSDSLREI